MSKGAQRVPCPYCGKRILPNAAKCRFCGEYLEDDEDEDDEGPPEREDNEQVVRWLVPVGRNPWAIAAGYLALLVFFPIPAVAYLIINSIPFPPSRLWLTLTSVIGIILAGLCLLASVLGFVGTGRGRKKKGGRGRVILGLVIGVLSLLLYLGLAVYGLVGGR
jgi:hypothetical protein